jgi:hypothetical protein
MTGAQIRDGLQEWWRPVLTLLCLPAAPYALYVGPFIGRPLSDVQMATSLTFVATLYAIREWGKVKAIEKVAAGSGGGGGYGFGGGFGSERPFEDGR